MHQLKYALGKEEKQQKSISRAGYSKINFNQSKSQSIWALDPDITGDCDEQNKNNTKLRKLKQNLESSLKNAFNKEKVFSEVNIQDISKIIFYEIVQKMQIILGEDIAEVDCLLEIQKKMKQILDNSRQQNKMKRIKKLKKKEKKTQLNEYDKIIHNNFKKKGAVEFINQDANNRQQYLEIKQNKVSKGLKSSLTINSNDGSSSKKSNSSTQDKLKGLLSQDKFSMPRPEEKDRNQRKNDSVLETNESVSFSAVISQSMAVRQRSPRINLNTKKLKTKEQFTNHHEKQEDKQEGKDEAFIFFRPKKTKKPGY